MSSLAQLVSVNDIAGVKQFLSTSPSPLTLNVANSQGITPIMVAASVGNPLMVTLLLQHGADPALQTPTTRNSALMFASKQGHCEVITILVAKANCDVNTGNSSGDTPLMFACLAGKHEAVVILLGLGARIDVSNKSSTMTALHCSMGSVSVAALLVQEAQGSLTPDAFAKFINVQNSKGKTSLMLATELGNMENVKLLVDVGADLALKDRTFMDALAHANRYKTRKNILAYLKNAWANLEREAALNAEQFTTSHYKPRTKRNKHDKRRNSIKKGAHTGKVSASKKQGKKENTTPKKIQVSIPVSHSEGLDDGGEWITVGKKNAAKDTAAQPDAAQQKKVRIVSHTTTPKYSALDKNALVQECVNKKMPLAKDLDIKGSHIFGENYGMLSLAQYVQKTLAVN